MGQDAGISDGSCDMLPDSLLLHIFSCMQSPELCRFTLPHVCKRWARLLAQHSPVWKDITVDFCLKKGTHHRLLRSALERWMHHRAAYTHQLVLRCSGSDTTHSFPADGHGLVNLFEMVKQRLTSLVIEDCNDIFLAQSMHQLSRMQALQSLHLLGLKHRIFARNIEALTSLRELKELRMTAAAAFEGDTRVHIFHGFPITVCKLPTLTSLQLSSAGIIIAPLEVSQLTSLQALDLSGCMNLCTLPVCLSRMTFLNQLRLADAFQAPLQIHETNNSIYTKWKFDLLDLSGNGYNHFPEELTHATVKTLVLSRNLLNNAAQPPLPAPVVNPMLRVEHLFLEQCDLGCVPPYIPTFTTLTSLFLSQNGLVALPDHFSALVNLCVLDAHANPFPCLPEVLTSLRKLKHLNLSACDYLEVASQASAEVLLQTAPSLLQIDLKKSGAVPYQTSSAAHLAAAAEQLKTTRPRCAIVF